jgi:hypothetical protein
MTTKFVPAAVGAARVVSVPVPAMEHVVRSAERVAVPADAVQALIVPPETTTAEVAAPAALAMDRRPPASIVAVAVVVVTEIALVPPPVNRPWVDDVVSPFAATVKSTAALADGTATTESSPAPSVVTATSAMRLRSVFVDMYFLSLVETGNFPISARRSFDLLIPYPVAHTCNAAKIRKPI